MILKTDLLRKKFSRRLERLERKLAGYQGKGFLLEDPTNEVRLISKVLGGRRLGIDVGGNRGDYTAALKHYFPGMEIHVFEPSPVNLEKLGNRFLRDQGVKIVGKALSSVEGAATLHSNTPGSGLGSLVKRRLDHFNIEFEVREPVETLRFERYWRDTLDSRFLDLVKFDIEGHELEALQGMGEALSHTEAVQFEFGGCNIDTRTYFQDFWYFFTERNFDIYRMSPMGLIKIDRYQESLECFLTTNYLAINRKCPATE